MESALYTCSSEDRDLGRNDADISLSSVMSLEFLLHLRAAIVAPNWLLLGQARKTKDVLLHLYLSNMAKNGP
jgi:hypothetical protein